MGLKDIFGFADLNRDGEIDMAELSYAQELLREDEEDDEDGLDDFDDELEMAGLDRDDLEFMDDDERREALEDAGLDLDDFDF